MTWYTRSCALVLLLTGATALVNAQIPNAGFENWTGGEPDNWLTNNIPPTPSITQSADAHSGASAVRGEVITVFSFPLAPNLVSTNEDGLGFPVNQRWAELRGWYKFATTGSDLIVVNIVMSSGDTAIGGGAALLGTSGAYASFSVPIFYLPATVPDTAYISVTIIGDTTIGGFPTVGANFHLDDLAFSGVSGTGEDAGGVPGTLALAQNYPNPFNPSTRIDFQVAVGGPVTLRIFDLLGREIATLVDQELAAGSHSRTFDAATLASGIYVYRLTSGGRSETRKMALVR
jgi:hypothetical protein